MSVTVDRRHMGKTAKFAQCRIMDFTDFTVTSYKCHGVSNRQQPDCLFNSLLRLRTKETSKLCNTSPLCGNPKWPVDSPHKGPVMQKVLSCYADAVIMHELALFCAIDGMDVDSFIKYGIVLYMLLKISSLAQDKYVHRFHSMDK